MDGSQVLLKIAKALHKRYPDVPIAPQVIIRQARVHLNTGKLQKADFILSNLINNNTSTEFCRRESSSSAVVFSQYGSLYVLTNVVAQGICLLSYSFSKTCPAEDQQTYLALAKEAFEIGLLTKTTGDIVISKLELHTFLKAAYCLATTHRWMTGPSEMVISAMSTCREAMTLFINYCARADSTLCTEIMVKIQQIKLMLKVEMFRKSDPCSFIPDSYHSVEFGPVLFTLSDFAKTLDVFGKHHKAFESGVKGGSCWTHAQCITAFQTDTEVLITEMQKADHLSPFSSKMNPSSSRSPLILVSQSCRTFDEQSSFGSYEVVGDFSNGSQEANIVSPSNRSSVSPSVPNTLRNNKGNQSQSQLMQEIATTEDVEDNPSDASQWRGNQKKLDTRTSSRSFSSGCSWERVSGPSQSGLETEEDVADPSNDSNDAKAGCTKDRRTSSFSLCNNSGSRSSWQELSISPSADGERLNHQSQSGIETEEEVIDLSHDSSEMNNEANVGCTKDGRTSSLCASSASHSSWQKLSISPSADGERFSTS